MRPVLFHLAPGFAVHSYGVLVAAGLILGVAIAVAAHSTIARVEPRVTLSAALVGLAGVLVGGHLLHWLVTGTLGGTVFLGGLLGGAVAVVSWSLVRGVRLPPLLDSFALGLPVGHALGRLGCLFAGCCFGQPWRGPFGVRFPGDSLAMRALVLDGAVPLTATRTPPLFPSQLAEAVLELALGAFLLWRHGRKRWHGELAVLWLGGYGLMRFGLEVFRGDHAARGYLAEVRWPALAHALGVPADEPLLLSTSQAIGFVLVVVALSFAVLMTKARRWR